MEPLVPLDQLRFVGHGLVRPECVLATRRGDLWVSDKRGGVARIGADGTQQRLGDGPIVPNGIALQRDGGVLVANLSAEGGVWRMAPDGAVRPFLLEVEGRRLPSVNFIWLDHDERLWVCVSTVREGGDQYHRTIRDGFIAVCDDAGARIVADQLCWTNECRIDAARRHLYVNETFGRRLTRYALGPRGALSERTTVHEFGHGDYPDGMAIDAAGGVWVVNVVSNRVLRIAPDGSPQLILEDPCADIDEIEALYLENRLTRPRLTGSAGRVLKNITSIAFGGADLRTVYLGCINGEALASFRSDVAGLAPPHWDW